MKTIEKEPNGNSLRNSIYKILKKIEYANRSLDTT